MTDAQVHHLEPTVHVVDTPNADNAPQPQEDESELLDYDIDDLREQLGLRGIVDALKTLTEKIDVVNSNKTPEAGETSTSGSVFDPTEGLEKTSSSETPNADSASLESSELLPSIFEETETFGPDVAEAIAKRINDSVSKKPMEEKLKELKDKYKTPKNCNLLCVPRVNLELWHDLPRSSKTKDLALQEIQKNLVKSTQPLLQMLEMTLKAHKEKKALQPNEIMSFVADAVTFLGHTSYLTSLKRREFLKPDIAQPYQSVCSKSNPMTTYLFGDELPKHIKDIGEVNKIAKKTMSRPHGQSSAKRRRFDYKNSSDNKSNQRGGRRIFLGSGSKPPYADRRQTGHQSASNNKVYRDLKDKTT